MQVQLFPEVVDIVAGLEQVAGRNLPELVGGVVVVAVDGEDGEGNVDLGPREVDRVGFVPVAHLNSYLFPPRTEDLVLEDIQAFEDALVGGVDLVEEISSEQ